MGFCRVKLLTLVNLNRPIVYTSIDKIWAADLVDMQAFSKYNKGVKYLLTVVDIFSKYGWIIPLKNKTGTEVASALQKSIQRT